MRKHNLQNEQLDQISRKLFKATRVSNEEIEKIVHAPQLFNAVKARIRAEEQLRDKPKRFFNDRVNVVVWNRQSVAGAFAILIVLATCAAVIVFKNQNSPELVKQITKPEIRPQVARAANQLPPAEIKESNIPAIKNSPVAEKIAFKAEKPKLPNLIRKTSPRKSIRNPEKESKEIFYSLQFAGNWQTEGEDLQIVRTEITRAELLALGINLPVENETAKIKTDLLVGTDGVARAIRFVE
jgi:hypothetical protein